MDLIVLALYYLVLSYVIAIVLISSERIYHLLFGSVGSPSPDLADCICAILLAPVWVVGAVIVFFGFVAGLGLWHVILFIMQKIERIFDFLDKPRLTLHERWLQQSGNALPSSWKPKL